MRFTQQALDAAKTLENIVVRHPSFSRAIETIEIAMQMGGGTGIHTGVRLLAPSGSGKSQLLKHLESAQVHADPVGSELHIISASLKENPSVSQLQGDLLRRFGYPLQGVTRHANNSDVNFVLVRAILQNQVKLLGFDEFQHVFLNGGTKVATPVIDWLKRLMNSTKVPVLLMGTEMLDRLEGVDPQLTTRVPTVAKLHHFRLNEEWIGFLQALASGYKPFDLSPLAQKNAQSLFRATHGSLRVLKGLLAHAIAVGITKGEAAITDEHLIRGYQMLFGQVALEENPFAIRR